MVMILPALKRTERLDGILSVAVTTAERARVQREATSAGLTIAAFVREKLGLKRVERVRSPYVQHGKRRSRAR